MNFNYLGTAAMYPFELRQGKIETVVGIEALKQSLITLISTKKGDMAYNLEYGCRINELMFEPNNAIIAGMGRQYIKEAIDAYEPRVAFLDSNITAENQKITINIKFRVKSSNEIGDVEVVLG